MENRGPEGSRTPPGTTLHSKRHLGGILASSWQHLGAILSSKIEENIFKAMLKIDSFFELRFLYFSKINPKSMKIDIN